MICCRVIRVSISISKVTCIINSRSTCNDETSPSHSSELASMFCDGRGWLNEMNRCLFRLKRDRSVPNLIISTSCEIKYLISLAPFRIYVTASARSRSIIKQATLSCCHHRGHAPLPSLRIGAPAGRRQRRRPRPGRTGRCGIAAASQSGRSGT
jgi:hypothetical protein